MHSVIIHHVIYILIQRLIIEFKDKNNVDHQFLDNWIIWINDGKPPKFLFAIITLLYRTCNSNTFDDNYYHFKLTYLFRKVNCVEYISFEWN
jgi:hypothetical protein